MKHLPLIFLMTLFTVSFVSGQVEESSTGQFMFAVKPQLFGMSGGSFGYKLPGDLVLFGGIDYLHLGVSTEISSTYLNVVGQYVPSSSSSKTEASFSVYNIYGAAKYFIVRKSSIRGYVLAEISKPIITVSVEENGKEDEDVKTLFDNLSIWGLKAAFGTEYFFSPNFSLGGEFGFRALLFGDEYTHDSPYYSYYYDPNTHQYTSVQATRRTDTKIDLDFSLTYSTLTLNYYF